MPICRDRQTVHRLLLWDYAVRLNIVSPTMRRAAGACAYCGRGDTALEREHAIPRCLYPASRAKSRVQRMTVPSCGPCNRGWADDEAHFRNVLLLSGDPNAAVQELWETTARRSFREVDGRRRLQDLVDRMVPVQVEGHDRWMIYPAQDERVLRVLRKIVRGLSHFHGVESAVSEERVWVDVMKYRIPEEFVADIRFHHREPDVCEYWYEAYDAGEFSSVWHLRFFERRVFVGSVSRMSDARGGLTRG